MARPSRCRRICAEPDYDRFVPDGAVCSGRNVLTLDEYEVIRLVDLEKFTHEQCAGQMDISRTTVTEIYESAREKIADSIVNGREIVIAGGNYRLCDGPAAGLCRKRCRRGAFGPRRPELREKGECDMRIAVTYEEGKVFQHFGHTEQFKIYDTDEEKILDQKIVDTNGSGHGALAGFLADLKVDALICGGIGGGARNALAERGIKLYGGVTGDADQAVKALLAGELAYNPDVQCSHHGHGEGEHGGECHGHHGDSCHGHHGENGHGCHGEHDHECRGNHDHGCHLR